MPEILDLVCSYVAERYKDEHDREQLPARSPSLQALSLTCRAFYEPSCSYIWSSVISIRPLVKCMPQDLWELEWREVGDEADWGEEPIEEPTVCLRRPIRPSDMEVFNNKARQVRLYGTTCLSSETRRKASNGYELPSLWRALNVANGGRCLFPNLKCITLSYREVSPEWLNFVHLYLSDTLELVHVDTASLSLSPLDRAIFFCAIEQYCPALDKLLLNDSLNFAEDRTKSPEAVTISNLICNLHHLTTISVAHPSMELIEKLSSIPTLRELDLYLLLPDCSVEPFRLSLPTKSSPHLGFPNLERLALQAGGIQFGIDFLNLLVQENSRLRSFEYELNACELANGWDRLLELLAAKASPSFLKHIRIIANSREKSRVVRGEHLQWLFPFVHLHYLEVGNPGGVHIDKMFVEKSARSWRSIKSLLFHTNRWPTDHFNEPTIKLIDLVTYAVECPQLVNLAIEIDTRNAESLHPDDRKTGALQTLYVGNSSPSSPSKTATLLRNIFPALKRFSLFPPRRTIRAHGHWNMELPDLSVELNRSSWTEVFAYLPNA